MVSLKAFEAALLRDFGPRTELERVLVHALRRGAGGRVYLMLMPDDALWLVGTRAGAPAGGAVLLELAAPGAPVEDALLDLRVRVIDWRSSERRYDALMARRARRPMP